MVSRRSGCLEEDCAQIGVPSERAQKEILEIFENIPQERISERTQTADAPVPQFFGKFSLGAHLGSYTDRRGANAAVCERDRRSGGVSPA